MPPPIGPPPLGRTTPGAANDAGYLALTLSLADQSDDLLVRHVRLLRDCVALAQRRWGFEIEAAVVLPSELQLLCYFENPQFGAVGTLKHIEMSFAQHASTSGRILWSPTNDILQIARSVVGQQRDLIENAPVRTGLVKNAADWPYSSAHKRTAQCGELGVAVA